MSVKVGMPILKLTNGAAKGKQPKHTAMMNGVVLEAFPSRGEDGVIRRLSQDADQTKLQYNEYTGYSDAWSLINAINAEVDEYSAAQVAAGKRAVRSNAIRAYGLICKPPAAWINGLSDDRKKQFWRDSDAIIEEFAGHGADGRNNIRATALHKDEDGDHKHYIVMPWTEDGRLSAKERVNLKMYSKLNREYPERMRALGWDISDCMVYDAAAVAQMSEAEAEEYKAEHKQRKSKKHGQSVADYKAQQAADKLAEAKQGLSEVERQQQAALQRTRTAQQMAEQYVKQAATAREEAETAKAEKEQAEKDVAAARAEAEELSDNDARFLKWLKITPYKTGESKSKYDVLQVQYKAYQRNLVDRASSGSVREVSRQPKQKDRQFGS